MPSSFLITLSRVRLTRSLLDSELSLPGLVWVKSEIKLENTDIRVLWSLLLLIFGLRLRWSTVLHLDYLGQHSPGLYPVQLCGLFWYYRRNDDSTHEHDLQAPPRKLVRKRIDTRTLRIRGCDNPTLLYINNYKNCMQYRDNLNCTTNCFWNVHIFCCLYTCILLFSFKDILLFWILWPRIS